MSATILLVCEKQSDRAHFEPAIALLEAAGITSAFREDSTSLADFVAAICLERGAPAQAIALAKVAQLPVLVVPWADVLPTSPASLLAMFQTPPELGIGVLALGEAGMKNAALSVIAMLALEDSAVHDWWARYRRDLAATVMADRDLL